MLKMGGVFGGATESQGSGLFGGEIDEDCSLTYSQRVWGFGICFGLGWFFSFLSSFFIFQIGSKPEKFAICYTFGALLALGSTAFLWGPVRQAKSMCAKERAVATSAYLLFLVLTLVAAFAAESVGLVIVCLICQFVAMVWYTLSYVPYGRRAAISTIKGCFGA